MEILVHGGAGSSPQEPATRQAVLDEAARDGAAAPDPASAVVDAVTILEDSPRFNAGVGGAVQSDGRIRTDAGIMTGDGSAGAVCGMLGVANAAQVANAVRTRTPHVLLCGEHAERFADEIGVPTDVDCWSDRRREQWHEEGLEDASYGEQLETVRDRFGDGADTVGAVATDGSAVAAATSTGGRWLALAGRVGDVPQIGCGFFASSAGAVSTTGAGEGIAKVTMARLAERELAEHGDPQLAAERALDAFSSRAAGTAGLIVISQDGERASAYSSELMQTAHARA